jgi:hypothetical protein
MAGPDQTDRTPQRELREWRTEVSKNFAGTSHGDIEATAPTRLLSFALFFERIPCGFVSLCL